MKLDVIRHYDLLIDENNDPVHDPETLRDYMDKWDGQGFIDRLELNKNKSVLEIGVGTGRLAVRVAPLCGSFFGIDISPKTIRKAKENLANFDNVTLICNDFQAYVFDRKFDVIYSSLTFMHVKDKQAAIKIIADNLNENGLFVLSIDKNQNKYIITGTNKIAVFPDNAIETENYLTLSGFNVTEHYKTEFAHIFKAEK